MAKRERNLEGGTFESPMLKAIFEIMNRPRFWTGFTRTLTGRVPTADGYLALAERLADEASLSSDWKTVGSDIAEATTEIVSTKVPPEDHHP